MWRKLRPKRARGLKLAKLWLSEVHRESRPTRARGLKLLGEALIGVLDVSRPMRARGLKFRDQKSQIVLRSRAPRGRVDLPVATWLVCDIERRINGYAMDILNL